MYIIRCTYKAFRDNNSEKSPYIRLEKMFPDKFLENKQKCYVNNAM